MYTPSINDISARISVSIPEYINSNNGMFIRMTIKIQSIDR